MDNLTSYWKNRFTNDVLTDINDHIKFVYISKNKPCKDCYIDCLVNDKLFGKCQECDITYKEKYTSLSYIDFTYEINNIYLRILADIDIEYLKYALKDNIKNNIYSGYCREDLLNELIQKTRYKNI